ncbi:hypothetical protein H8D04_00760 [bacterium]|nr:hypothetical protein [bacterium]
MASSNKKKLTEEQIQEGLIDKIAKKIVLHIFNNKLSAIEKMGIPDDVKKASKEADKAFKNLNKSLKRASKLDKKLNY